MQLVLKVIVVSMHGMNNVELQYGIWSYEPANLHGKASKLEPVHCSRRPHATSYKHTKNPVHVYCHSTAKGERQPKVHELQ